MCDMAIVGVMPLANGEPSFDPNFDYHMRGEQRGTSTVSGIHTLHGRKEDEDFVFVDKHLKTEGDRGTFRAKVRLIKETGGKTVKSDPKLSTFWPTEMCLTHIRQAVILAWRNAKARGTVSSDGKEKWIGEVQIGKYVKQRDQYNKWVQVPNVTTIRVGSPQTGTENNRLFSAYPII